MGLNSEGKQEVQMHNSLVRHTMESMTHLSVIDQRVVGYLVATGIKNPKNEEMPKRVKGSVSELAKICNITGHGKIYKGVRKSTESLMTQLIRFKHPDSAKDVSTTWLAEGVYDEGEGTFEVEFSSSMQRLLTELSKHRTVMELETMLGLGSGNYAIRLYQLAKSYQSVGGWVTPISLLREQLGVPKGSYKRISDFRAMVLNYPLKAINNKSDIEINYDKNNKGRSWKEIIFLVEKSKPKSSETSANLPKAIEWYENLKGQEREECDLYLMKYGFKNKGDEALNKGLNYFINEKRQGVFPFMK